MKPDGCEYHRLILEEAVASSIQMLLCSSDSMQDTFPLLFDKLLAATESQRIGFHRCLTGKSGIEIFLETESAIPPDSEPAPPLGELPSSWEHRLERKAVVCGHVAEFPVPEQAILTTRNTAFILVIPVFVGNELRGTLILERNSGVTAPPWSSSDISLLLSLSDAIGAHIAKRELEAELMSQTRQLRRLQEIIDRSPVYAMTFGPSPQFTIRFCSDNIHRLIGCPASELMTDNSLVSHIHPEDRERVVHETLFYTNRKLPIFNLIFRVLNRNGYVRYVEERASVQFDETGNAVEYRAVFIDVTEQKSFEEALKMAQFCLDFAEIGIFWISPEGRIVYANHCACRTLGYTHSELMQMQISEIDPEQPNETRTAFWESFRKRGILRAERSHRRKTGELIPVEITGHHMTFDGHEFEFIFAADISERKRAEETARRQREQLVQSEKMATLGTLVSGIGHEINNPNAFIMLNAPVLRDIFEAMLPRLLEHCRANGIEKVGRFAVDNIERRVRQLLEGIGEGSVRIRDIVYSLREFARHNEVSENEPVPINDAVTTATLLVMHRIRMATGRFQSVSHDPSPVVMGNIQRIEQVVVNLLTNACDALTNPEQAIIVRTERDPKTGIARIVVEDEGCGIPEEIRSVITDPFFTTKRHHGGTGLGLSICLSIVNDHRGRLHFESKPGGGTIVTVEIPLAATEEGGAA